MSTTMPSPTPATTATPALTTPFGFTIDATDPAPHSAARAGTLATPHGPVRTPVFMPVGTRATVKGILPAQLEDLGAQIILANSYHLYLRPGSPLIREAGGLHRFMNWHHPILTDSGGFQIFSLADTLKVSDEGLDFASILDGSRHHWTPEDNMCLQNELGADIIMQLDQCAPYPCEKSVVAQAVSRSATWARRCRASQTNPLQALFAIVQGGTFLDLRQESVARLLEIDAQGTGFEGFALGGYSVGEPHELMFETLGTIACSLPSNRPRYLMGVGNPSTLLKGVEAGIDMFDCVLPTRTARMGTAFTGEGKLNLRNARFARDLTPLDAHCTCPACTGYTRAYLRHLILSKEILAAVLLSLHNLHYLITLMTQAREAILKGTYAEFVRAWERSPAAADL